MVTRAYLSSIMDVLLSMRDYDVLMVSDGEIYKQQHFIVTVCVLCAHSNCRIHARGS